LLARRNAVAVETARGWRLAKEKASRKIDAVVALSFASLDVVERPPAGPVRLLNPNDLGVRLPLLDRQAQRTPTADGESGPNWASPNSFAQRVLRERYGR
jgi:hypothetical protein